MRFEAPRNAPNCTIWSRGIDELTFGNVAGLVLTPPAEDLVFDPWDPAFVLLVVPVP